MYNNPLRNIQSQFIKKLINTKMFWKGYLNANLLRNTFVGIEELIKDRIDVYLKSETKLDKSFTNQQF